MRCSVFGSLVFHLVLGGIEDTHLFLDRGASFFSEISCLLPFLLFLLKLLYLNFFLFIAQLKKSSLSVGGDIRFVSLNCQGQNNPVNPEKLITVLSKTSL